MINTNIWNDIGTNIWNDIGWDIEFVQKYPKKL